ncbi:28S ribosomal protein S30, mitochondrial [Rhipicephalus sanguineus]|uniref:28S ribosomal protein S30, mitochondrial n=1 Tax=Rhipicephalus sanguineus TaxID=34632 RepID=UPI0018948937|nr:28S ribosomal protein S30, mitochondrial [Rhipicephalus sanguineus]
MATKILTHRRILECARNLRFTSHYPKLLNPDIESEYVYTDEPKYPTILDTSYTATKRREREEWRESIKAMPTVQQKLGKMTELGLQFCYLAQPDTLYYNCLPAYQYATRTHLIEGLPDVYEKIDVEDAYARLKPHLVDAVASELEMLESGDKCRGKTSESVKQEKIIARVLSVLLRGLAKDAPHLQTSQVDYRPRCDAFWKHARYYPNERRRFKDQDTITMNLQFMDKPDAQVRITEPLPAIVSLDDPLVCSQEVPDFPYHPSYMKFKWKKKYQTSLPGTWPLHECNFPLLTIRQRSQLIGHHDSPFKTAEEVQDAANAAAILSGFGWLNGVATQLGFTIYHDPTYPLVSHVVNTDGQHWTFAVYQLNTLRFHYDCYESNPLRNLCWSSGNLRLFEAYENGELKGIDDSVFKLLLRFLLRQPKAPEGIELRPYLGVDTRPEEERQEQLKYWMRTYDCRFQLRTAIDREVPMWVKIYKWHEDAPPTPHINLK